jgi:hypothetical protein
MLRREQPQWTLVPLSTATYRVEQWLAQEWLSHLLQRY